MSFIYTPRGWCQTAVMAWLGTRQGISTHASSKDGKSRGPSIPVTKVRRVIALLTHTDSQLLCQFGCSPPVTQNAATPSLQSRAVSASHQPGQSQAPAPDNPTRSFCSCRAQLRLAGIPLWAVEQGMSSSREWLILL